jgi:hypothetical protein
MPTNFPLKEWEDEPNETTPIDRESLRDAEQRLAEWAENPEALPEIVVRSGEKELGKIAGLVKCSCAEATLFIGEITGALEVEFTNAPNRPWEGVLILENTGEFAFTIKGLKWSGKEPTFILAPGERYEMAVLIRKAGAEIIGRV